MGLFAGLFASNFLFAAQAPRSPDFDQLSLQHGCAIYSTAGALLAQFPGNLCHFYDDGSVLISTNKELTLLDRSNRKVWTIPGHFHHQLKPSLDGKRILAIASESVTEKSVTVRYDRIVVIGMDGKILSQVSFQKVLSDTKLAPSVWPFTWGPDYAGPSIEATHVNSIDEIPQHSNRSALTLFPPGAFLVNSTTHGLFVLGSDLKHVIHHFSHPDAIDHAAHDAQITPEGRLLIFVNRTKFAIRAGQSKADFSSVRESDPITLKSNWVFQANPRDFFYSYACGGVQRLTKDYVLISDALKGAFVVDRRKNTVVLHALDLNAIGPEGVVLVQEIKAYDLGAFFRARPAVGL